MKIEPGAPSFLLASLTLPSSYEQNVKNKMDAYIATKVKGPKSALAVVMNMTLKHTADVLNTFMTIVAEKYGIDMEEMMETVRTDERFTGIAVDPLLHAITGPPEDAGEVPLVNPLVAEAPAAPAAVAPLKKRGPKKLSEMTAEERAAHDAKMAGRKAAKVAAAVAAVAPVAEPPAPAEPKVTKTFKLKPKAVAPAPAPAQDA